MALIHCYDVSDLDRKQLQQFLGPLHKSVEFTQGPLTPENTDAGCEVVAVFIGSRVTAALMDKMPKLKLVACRSTGFNNVDLEAAAKRNVKVANVPTYGDNTVAEYAFALLLALTRRLPRAMAMFAQGESGHELLRGTDLQGKTLGVVGAGHIGCNMARIGNGFGMKVLAYDPYPAAGRDKEFGFEYVPLVELLRQSDAVSLHVPLLPSTRYLIDREKLSLMKPTAVLVNTARGEIVDTQSLTEVLIANQLGGAALDVFEGEELQDVDSEMQLVRSGRPDPMLLMENMQLDVLKKLPNVIITNHNGFNTSEAIGRINEVTAINIKKFLAGKPQNEVEARS
jgi:D-lactate dehydrogenase